MSSLKYTDEKDRSLGLAGTAVAMVVWHAHDKLVAVSIDSEPGAGVEVTPDFHFQGNPRLSAAEAWRTLVQQLQVTTAMLMGNAMSRAYLGHNRPLSSQTRASLRALVRDEAEAVCALTPDETDRLFTEVNQYLDRVFTHHRIATLTRSLAQDIVTERRLSAAEVLDRLAPIIGI